MLSQLISSVFNLTFLSLISLALLQQGLQSLPEKKLTNVPVKSDFEDFSRSSLFNGSFQRSFETWFMQNSGLWGALVTSNNEINYRIFSQLDSEYKDGNGILVGTGYALFQGLYLQDFNADYQVPVESLRQTVATLRELQSWLEARRKTLLVVTSANKLILHPEYVPARYTKTRESERYIEVFRRLAAESNLNFLDTGRELLQFKEAQNFPLYAAPAAHWNTITACHVAARILQESSRLLRKPLNALDCSGAAKISPNPRGSDRDLAAIINVWNPRLSFVPTPYIKSKLQPVPQAYDAHWLFIGTSYMWSLLAALEREEVYTQRDFYYYGRSRYFRYVQADKTIKKAKQAIDYESLNWLKLLEDKDILVFEVNEARLPEVGFDFLAHWKQAQMTGKF